MSADRCFGYYRYKRRGNVRFGIEEMNRKRQAARKDRNFALADQIRDELLAKGIILEDTREGVKWKKA